MEDLDIFNKEIEEIKKLSDRLEKLKYIRLCFIDLIDQGATFNRDYNIVTIKLNIEDAPTDYKLLPNYHSKLSTIYDSINESIDKVNLKFNPLVEVKSESNSISIKLTTYKLKKVNNITTNSHLLDQMRDYLDQDYSIKNRNQDKWEYMNYLNKRPSRYKF